MSERSTGSSCSTRGVVNLNLWLVAAAVSSWAGAAAWARYTDRVVKRYRTERNAVDAGETSVANAPAD